MYSLHFHSEMSIYSVDFGSFPVSGLGIQWWWCSVSWSLNSSSLHYISLTVSQEINLVAESESEKLLKNEVIQGKCWCCFNPVTVKLTFCRFISNFHSLAKVMMGFQVSVASGSTLMFPTDCSSRSYREWWGVHGGWLRTHETIMNVWLHAAHKCLSGWHQAVSAVQTTPWQEKRGCKAAAHREGPTALTARGRKPSCFLPLVSAGQKRLFCISGWC